MTTYSQRAPFYNAISSTARVTSAIMCGHMAGSAKLIFLCGKMAAGKSTLARELADRENAVLLVQRHTFAFSCRKGSPSCSISQPPRKHSGRGFAN